MEDRKPPYSIEAEKGLLASIIIEDDGTVITQCVESGFKSDFFYRLSHQVIFASMDRIYRRGGAIDETTLADQLEKDKEIESSGGHLYLIELSDSIDTALNASEWAKIVREKYCLRELIRSYQTKIDEFYANPNDLKAVLDESSDTIAAIQIDVTSRREKSKEEVFRDIWKDFEDSRQGIEPPKIVYTPIPQFEERFKRVKPHELIILGARTGQGKTSMALSVSRSSLIADRNLDQILASPEAHVYFTVEMGPSELIERSSAQIANVDPDRLARETEQDVNAYKKWLGFYQQVTEKRFFIRWTRSLPHMEAELRKIEGRHGKIKVIVVDYIQKVNFPGSEKMSMAEKYGHISGTLKEWTSSGSFGCPVIGCAQIGREVSKEEREPEIHDLRSSGDLEQDADRVWLLHKPKSINYCGAKVDNQNDMEQWPLDNPQKVLFKQEKCRSGPMGRQYLSFIRKSTKFKEWSG